jgi:hypothetical protein
MKKALGQAFDAVADNQQEISRRITGTSRSKFRDLAAKSRTEKIYRLLILEKFVEYADSLSGIVERAKGSQEDIKAVADIGRRLATFAPEDKQALPTFIIGVLEKALSEAVKISAAADLASAVDQAHAVVTQLTDVVIEDLKDLANVLRGNIAAARASVDTSFQDFIQYRNLLLADRKHLVDNLQNIKGDKRLPELEKIKRIEELLQMTAADQAELERLRAAVVDAVESGIGLVEKTKVAVRLWKDAHKDLAQAIRVGRNLNVRNLKVAVDELVDLIERGRKVFADKRAKE